MARLFTNNATGKLAAPLDSDDNTLLLETGQGALFPSPTGDDYFTLTLTQMGQETSWEIVKATGRVGDTLSVTRAQEGTAALEWAVGSKAELRITAGALEAKSDTGHTHSEATTSVAGFMSGADKSKLDGIAENANNYTHPANHPASIIEQDSNNRFVTDAEKTAWNAKQAALVSGTNIKTINGVSLLGSGNVAIESGTGVTVTGSLTLYATQSTTLTITNFDSATTYSVSVTGGTATITGDQITYTAGATAGTYAITINGRAVPVTVQPASVLAPTITNPTNGATGVSETPTVTTSAFSAIGLADTHLNSDFELWTGANRTGTKVASTYADTVNKTSWTIPAGMAVNTTYYLSALHRGSTLGASAWTEISFTTAASFNSYIATPTATPANFGDALEGGFYAGMYWDQIAQSSSSKTLATGTQTFTVPDMTSTPIVYAGQSLEVRSRANPANKFIGTVTGATGTTLTLDVTSIGGSGTFSDWSVMSRFRSIDAPKASGEHAGIALKNANTALPSGCQTLVDGWAATEAMRLAGNSTEYPAAHWARGLNIGGYTDWHIPARDVLELRWRNLKPTTTANYTTANRDTGQSFDYKINGAYGDTANTHGLNNNSSPTGAAYTASVPGQTAATAFRTGGAEAYEFGSAYYWSSTEYSATYAWRQYWHSSFPGCQNSSSKTLTLRVRAVRRSII